MRASCEDIRIEHFVATGIQGFMQQEAQSRVESRLQGDILRWNKAEKARSLSSFK